MDLRNTKIDLAGSTYADRMELHEALRTHEYVGFHQNSVALKSDQVVMVKRYRYAYYDYAYGCWLLTDAPSLEAVNYRELLNELNPPSVNFRKLEEEYNDSNYTA